MRQRAAWVGVGCLGVLFLAAQVRGDEPSEPGAAQPDGEVLAGPLRYRIDTPAVYIGTIESEEDSGALRLALRRDPSASIKAQRSPTEGYYLGLAQPVTQFQRTLDDAKVLRVLVTDVLEGGAVLVQVDPAAVPELEPGGVVSLHRPQGSTTALLQAAPGLAPLVDARAAGSSLEGDQAASLAQSQNNLKQIGLALHEFLDKHGCFPPAVVFGPDGKPWHSWRVLLLPFLDEISLSEQYSFDEPWDGPNNRKLLKKTPPVYRDPVYGDEGPQATHYAAIVGKGTAFPPQGIKFDGTKSGLDKALRRGAGVVSLPQITDGTSNSLVVGSVAAERDIPWTEPDDVTLAARLPPLGEDGSFAAPYRSESGAAGVFLFADGSVHTIRGDVKPDVFRKLLTISGGELVGERDIPGLVPPKPRGPAILAIEVVSTANGPLARLVEDGYVEPEVPGEEPSTAAPEEDPGRPPVIAPSKPRPDTEDKPAGDEHPTAQPAVEETPEAEASGDASPGEAPTEQVRPAAPKPRRNNPNRLKP